MDLILLDASIVGYQVDCIGSAIALHLVEPDLSYSTLIFRDVFRYDLSNDRLDAGNTLLAVETISITTINDEFNIHLSYAAGSTSDRTIEALIRSGYQGFSLAALHGLYGWIVAKSINLERNEVNLERTNAGVT